MHPDAVVPGSARRKVARFESALCAVVGFIVLALLLRFASEAVARREMNRIAPVVRTEKNQGFLLARAAIARPDLLLLYGSSELVRPSEYRAGEFFASLPTGFAVFPIGDLGTPPLVALERIASLGDRLRGRKVVVLLTPRTFTAAPGLPDRQPYLGVASRLQLGDVLFGNALDRRLRRQLAGRLLAYPEVLAGDSFLATALELSTHDSTAAQWAAAVIRRLGRAQNRVLELSDQARVLLLPWRLGAARVEAARGPPAPPDFPALIQRAEIEYGEEVRGHAFGFRPAIWADPEQATRGRGRTTDAQFLAALSASPRWIDLKMTFQLLERQGADALVLSLPFAGTFWDHTGVSGAARQVYYRRVRELAERHEVRSLTLESLEYEPLFFKDPYFHPSPKGWLMLDSIINDFYHDDLH